MRAASLFAGAALSLLACRPATPDTTAEARAAIDSNNAAWARLSAAGHADSITQFYHPTAVIMPPNMAPVRGLDSIRAFFTVLNTMSSPPPTLTLRAEAVWASGPSATEVGRWTFTWAPSATRPPGMPPVDSGTGSAKTASG
jgi:ketosteroid isomerase-like protein